MNKATCFQALTAFDIAQHGQTRGYSAVRFSLLWILPLLAPLALARENLYRAPGFEESGVVGAVYSGERAG